MASALLDFGTADGCTSCSPAPTCWCTGTGRTRWTGSGWVRRPWPPCQLLDHGTGYLCAAAALQALTRQSVHGGTHFRELSLARTAQWLLGQPRETLSRETAEPPPAGDVDGPAWLTTLDSAAGPVTTVLPPGRLDDHALTWPRALSRYGGDEAAWKHGWSGAPGTVR